MSVTQQRRVEYEDKSSGMHFHYDDEHPAQRREEFVATVARAWRALTGLDEHALAMLLRDPRRAILDRGPGLDDELPTVGDVTGILKEAS